MRVVRAMTAGTGAGAALAALLALLLALLVAAARPAPPPERGASAAQRPAAVYRIVPGLSAASYAVDEVFFRESNRLFTAVGVTREVAGELVVDRDQPAQSRVGEIVVDVHALASDDRRRDDALRRKYLESSRIPQARFANATLHHLPAAVREGAPVPFTIVGDLTVRGVTRRTTWHAEAVLRGDTLRARASARVRMSDFGVEVPHLLGTLRSEDDVTVKLELVAVAAGADAP